MRKLYSIAVNTPFNNSILSYWGESTYQVGELVIVPLGKRNALGCVLGESNDQSVSEEKVRSITEKAYPFSLEEGYVKFLEWVSEYYHYPLGQLISDILPKEMKRPRAIKKIEGSSSVKEIPLNQAQLTALAQVTGQKDKFERWLLHGVTGSGKSNVYLSLIREQLMARKSVLFLLPEINLTQQFIQMFQEHLDTDIFIYNSSITASDKFGLWSELSERQAPCVVIGVRSAVFLPFRDLGLIIVDEEHDPSFKQEDRCAYNARDLSIKRASELNIPVVLGSATPSAESYVAARDKKTYLTLPEMAISSHRPHIELIDLKDDIKQETWPFHPAALEQIDHALKQGEQVLVFLNKLGYADYLQCKTCGHHFSCPNCSANLKFFKAKNTISCQICSFEDRAPSICPSCANMNIKQIGYGTEKISQVLQENFPERRVSRFDRDELKTAKNIEDRLGEFHRGEIDLLIGTQMLSKGHNFQRVNLVVVMGIDSQLNFPDFRAMERTYQLLVQVAGRPGRFGQQGRVLVQTLNEKNPLFEIVQRHEFTEFYEQELKVRELCQAPPYAHLAMIYLTGKKQSEVSEEAQKVATFLNHLRARHFKEIEILGPRPALIEKRVNKFTWALMIKSKDRGALHNSLKTLKKNWSGPSGIGLKVDIDPYHIS